jgi:hypothetical protein
MQPAVPEELPGLAQLAPLMRAALSQVTSRETVSGAQAGRARACSLAAEKAAAFERRLRAS